MRNELRGTKENPYHKSIGAVIKNNNEEVVIIKKLSGQYTLVRETQYLDESPEECIKRGAKEELGININVGNFLGTLLVEINLPNGTRVLKSTDYFLANTTDKTLSEEPENGKPEWNSISEAIKKIESNGEYDSGVSEIEILKRVM